MRANDDTLLRGMRKRGFDRNCLPPVVWDIAHVLKERSDAGAH